MMKKNLGKYIQGILCAGLLAACFSSCEMKNELWGKDPNEISPDEAGILDLKLEVKKPSYEGLPATKAESNGLIVPEAKDLQVKIFNESMELQDYFESYQAYLDMEEEYLVPAGTYYVEAFTGDNYEVTTDHPYYAVTDTCEVKLKEVTSLNSVCELQSAIISLVLNKEFLDACKDDYAITITNGSGVMSLGKGDPQLVYVRPGSEIRVTVRATEKKTGTPVMSTFVLGDENGNINPQDLFKIEIKDLEEEEIPVDPEKPVNGSFSIKVDVTLSRNNVDIIVPSVPGTGGGDIGDGGDTSDGNITFSGNALVEPLIVSAPKGIEKMEVKISSTNSEFSGIIAGMGLTSFDVANMSSDLEKVLVDQFHIVDGSVKGKITVSFDIAGLLGLLDSFSGKHDFQIKVTDSNGNTNSTTITKTI